MSRETKIGLLVAGAFVSLLTVVVVNRLQQEGDDSPKDDTPVVVRAVTKPPAPVKPHALPEKTHGSELTPTVYEVPAGTHVPERLPSLNDTPLNPGTVTLPLNPSDSAVSLPPVIQTPPVAPQLQPLTAPTVSVKDVPAPGLPPGTVQLPLEKSTVTSSLNNGNQQPPPPFVGVQPPSPPVVAAVKDNIQEKKSPAPIQMVGVQGIDLKDNKPLPVPLPSQVAPVQLPLAVPPANTADKQAEELAKIIAQQEKADKDQKAKPEPDAKAKAPAPPLSLGGPPPISPPPGNELSPLPPLQPMPVKSPGQVGGLTPFSENKGVALPPTFGDASPTVPIKKQEVQPPIAPPASLDPVQKPINQSLPGSTGGIVPLPSVGIGSTEVPPLPTPITQSKPMESLPNLGSAPNVSVPVISVATPPNQATQPPASHTPVVVKSYEVHSHVWQPEDKSFEDLSKRFYQSERYAAALLEYNRKDHRASPGLLQNPPQLQPGMKVYVPPWDKLQESFPHLIPQQQTLAPSGITPPGNLVVPSSTSMHSPAIPAVSEKLVPVTTAPLVQTMPPLPVAVTPVATPPAKTLTPVSATTAVEGTRQYQVQGQGEPMVEIARRMLGDEMRWGEIYRLNPTIDPRYPVPAGTTLRMP